MPTDTESIVYRCEICKLASREMLDNEFPEGWERRFCAAAFATPIGFKLHCERCVKVCRGERE